MGIWSRLFSRKSSASITHPYELFVELFGGRTSSTGIVITPLMALQAMAFLCGTRVLAEGIAQMPLKLYQSSDDGRSKEPAREHPLYKILTLRPNSWQSSFSFRETLMFHSVLGGNGYAFINRLRSGIVELLPLLPSWVAIKNTKGFDFEYELRLPNQDVQTLSKDKIFHLRGPSWDSVSGLDAVKLAAEVIGYSLQAEKNASTLAKRGGRPPGVLSSEQNIGPEQVERIKKAWNDAFSGENANNTAVLDAGYKWMAMAQTGIEQQAMEMRRFAIEDAGRALRVFPIMMMQADKASTFASAEQFFLAHVIHSLGPWITRWEQSIDGQLLTDAEQDSGLFSKFSVQSLLRGDHTSRANFYKAGILDGWMTRNEARSLEDLNPLDGLDDPLRPLNMGPGDVKPPAETPDAPKPAAGDSEGDDEPV
jgi:HK97 family phage portal protein